MDILAAISTAPAASGIGIVRVSGAGCFALCDSVFRAANGLPLSAQTARKMVYGEMLDTEKRVIDRGLAVRFPAPHSFTGEDIVELNCHGSPVVLREVLSALFAAGARQAAAGEFTRRAFLNGRLDLTEAEAVIDLIDAQTPAAARNAAAQLDGALYRALAPVQDALLDITSRFYAVVDYPDEDIEDIHPAQIAQALTAAEDALARLLGTAQRGKILKNGVRTAIVGRPNAGKSSLLNALAGYERAIVTDIPGTTRDTVEETVLCGDVALRLIDTAGIRDTEDTVERLGVARSRAAMESADLVLAVVDGSAPITQEDLEVLRLASHCPRWIAVFSKCDLWNTKARSIGVIGGASAPAASVSAPAASVSAPAASVSAPAASVTLSSVTGEGLEDLERAVAALFPAGANADAGALLTDARQEEAALRARRAVVRAREALEAGFTPDAVLTDAEEALEAVGELTGRTAKEEIVERIFSRFCVGK